MKAREKALDRSYFPRFNLQGTAYARGTGIDPTARRAERRAGLGRTIQNWGVGMTVTFPAFDLPSIRARKAGRALPRAGGGGAVRPGSAGSERASWRKPTRRSPARARRAEHADPARSRARHRAAGHGALQGRARQHRRSGRGAAPAHAGGNRRCAGAVKHLARAAGGCRGGGRPAAVPGDRRSSAQR